MTDVAHSFPMLVGHPPEGVWQAPGRVNLIGEHTDYCGGFAITFAIDRRTTVAAGRRGDRCLSVRSTAIPDPDAEVIDLDALEPGVGSSWALYPFGVIWALRSEGVDVGGLDLVIDSTVPMGGGLSSSASLEAAVAVAVTELADVRLGLLGLATICHRAESDYAGAPTGLLDPLAVLGATEGHGMLIDFRSLEVEQVPLPVGPLGVVDTGVRHDNTDGAYAQRRRACEDAASTMGVPQLRDANEALVGRCLSGVAARRARHVITENERVLETARRLATGGDIGVLLDASHVSLRNDFEVSCPELDTAVTAARAAGARGARMTGAGFGGSCIAVGADADGIDAMVTRAFASHGYRTRPTTFAVTPSLGAGRLS
ncbi:MAG: galactokinase [Actinomycetota bacterium]|nr:galactokinase [Actinomycetota bacterium]